MINTEATSTPEEAIDAARYLLDRRHLPDDAGPLALVEITVGRLRDADDYLRYALRLLGARDD